MSPTTSDPFGKRALFDPAADDDAAKLIKPTVRMGEQGKASLFTAGERRPGTVVLTCSSCRARSRVSLLELGLAHLPFWLWIPGRPYSRLLRCPACEQRTWVAVNWFA